MTSDNRSVILVVALLALAIGGYAYWWLQTHELVEREFRQRPEQQVRQNPFRAAQLFLEQKGYQVELSNGLNRFQALPSNEDMIIGERLGGRLPEQRVDDVLDWVAGGGQLLTSVQRSWSHSNLGAADKLLNKLDITIWSVIDEDSEQAEDTDDEVVIPDFDVISSTLQNGETVSAEFDYGLSLYDSSDRETHYLSSETSNHLLIIPHGEGWVMLATDLSFIRNPSSSSIWNGEESAPNINHRDHAFLLNWLAESNKKIWLVRRTDATPITTLVWQHSPHAVIALTVLLIIWLWWLYNRFGPLRASVTPERRNILEHLKMSAVYAWRHDRAQQLFADTRNDINLLIRRKHPQVAALTNSERCTKLAELFAHASRSHSSPCTLSAEQIDKAMHGDWRGEREFIELTHLLQQIRKAL